MKIDVDYDLNYVVLEMDECRVGEEVSVIGNPGALRSPRGT